MRNKTGLRSPMGYLDPSCEQAVWWQRIYGSLDVPLKSFVQHMGKGPNGDDPAERFYMLDVDKLSAEQLEELCQIMADKFDVPIAEVRKGVHGDHGFPIRAKLLTAVSADLRMFL